MVMGGHVCRDDGMRVDEIHTLEVANAWHQGSLLFTSNCPSTRTPQFHFGLNHTGSLMSCPVNYKRIYAISSTLT
jgi:hypothetical protein